MPAQTITQVEAFMGIKAAMAAAGFDLSLLTPETRIGTDLPIDSLEMVEIVLDLEHRFGVPLDDREVRRCATLRDLTDLVLNAQMGQ
jgi:acyl carrier protein